MSPIEIDPVTGAPIVVPAKTENFTVVETVKTKPPVDAIISPKPTEKPAGMEGRIESAKKFNQQLINTELMKDTISATSSLPIGEIRNKDVELMSILKRYGMDSQQQEKAFSEIKVLFTN